MKKLQVNLSISLRSLQKKTKHTECQVMNIPKHHKDCTCIQNLFCEHKNVDSSDGGIFIDYYCIFAQIFEGDWKTNEYLSSKTMVMIWYDIWYHIISYAMQWILHYTHYIVIIILFNTIYLCTCGIFTLYVDQYAQNIFLLPLQTILEILNTYIVSTHQTPKTNKPTFNFC